MCRAISIGGREKKAADGSSDVAFTPLGQRQCQPVQGEAQHREEYVTSIVITKQQCPTVHLFASWEKSRMLDRTKEGVHSEPMIF